MNQKRSSFTAKSAIRFVSYFNKLLDIYYSNELNRAIVLPLANFDNIEMSTLVNRITDALLWLRRNDLPGNKYKQQDYEFLASILVKRKEATVLRLCLVGGQSVEEFVRSPGETNSAADWKTKVVYFIEQDKDRLIQQFEGCIFSPDDVKWIENICSQIGAQHNISGDKLTIVKGA